MKSVRAIELAAAWGLCALVATARADEPVDWLRIAPGDAHFYVEIRDLSGIRGTFFNLGIWETVRGLSSIRAEGVPDPSVQMRAGGPAGWHPDAAIAMLLGRRSAMLSSTTGGWQSGLVVCEAINDTHIEMMLQLWAARRTGDEGSVRRYVLEGGSLLAVRGRTLVFGPAGDADGLWGRAVLLLAGQRGPTLGARAEFASLRTLLSQDYPATIYASWPKGDVGAFAGCERLIAGARVERDRIECELHGELGEPELVKAVDPSWLKKVPANTVALWCGSHQFSTASAPKPIISASEKSIAEYLTTILRVLDLSSSNILDKLGRSFTLIVGTQPDSSNASLLLPQLTVAIEIDPEVKLSRLDDLFGNFVRLLVLMASTPGQPLMTADIREIETEGVAWRAVRTGPALAGRTGLDFLRDAEFCWGLVDGRLLLSSSSHHMRSVIEARRGRSGDSLITGLAGNDKLSGYLWVRGDKLAEMCSSWLDELQRKNAAAMEAGWWRRWASSRMANQQRLGLGLADDPGETRAAVVREVGSDSPARGLVEVGDVIVGAAGEALTTSQPARQVADRYAARGSAREFHLDIRRGGKDVRVSVPVESGLPGDLSNFDPVNALRQTIALSRRASSITVSRFATKPDRLDARMEVKWDAAAKDDN